MFFLFYHAPSLCQHPIHPQASVWCPLERARAGIEPPPAIPGSDPDGAADGCACLLRRSLTFRRLLGGGGRHACSAADAEGHVRLATRSAHHRHRRCRRVAADDDGGSDGGLDEGITDVSTAVIGNAPPRPPPPRRPPRGLPVPLSVGLHHERRTSLQHSAPRRGLSNELWRGSGWARLV